MRVLFIPGMPKSGTTFLTHSLLHSGAICQYTGVPKAKEIRHFNLPRNKVSRDQFLQSFLPGKNHQWKCDATPVYIYDENTVDSINEILGNDEVHFIICLRERVRQIYSWYVHFTINRLIFDFWEKSCFENLETPSLFQNNSHYSIMFKPLYPSIDKMISIFGENCISIFNHHSDYHEDSPFWNSLSERLGAECRPHPTFTWSQNFIPEVYFFDKPQAKIIDGREYFFSTGDLLVAAGPRTRLFRGLTQDRGRNVIRTFNQAITKLDHGEINVIKNIVYEDFEKSLDALGVSINNFPEPAPLTLSRAEIASSSLEEVPSTPIKTENLYKLDSKKNNQFSESYLNKITRADYDSSKNFKVSSEKKKKKKYFTRAIIKKLYKKIMYRFKKFKNRFMHL